jgi:hypothetical protein
MKDPLEDLNAGRQIEPQIIFTDEELRAAGFKRPQKHESLENGGTSPISHKRALVIDPSDLIAIGILILAVGAVLVAIIFSIAVAMGKVPVKDASTVILGCVGGAAISGVVAALLGKKSKERS